MEAKPGTFQRPGQRLPRSPYKPRWDQLEIRKPSKAVPTQKTDITFEGWDTETVRNGPFRGSAFILANSQNWLPLGDRNPRQPTWWEPREVMPLEEIFHYMVRFGEGKINAFWNIDFDFSAIIKRDHAKLQELYPEGGKIGEAKVGPFKVKYLRKKFFEIKYGNKVARFYDAFLFYQQTLARAAKTYLHRDPPDLKSRRHEDLALMPLAQVAEYCRDDAQNAKDLMALFYAKLAKMDFQPRKPISPGFIAKDFVRIHSDMPHAFAVPPYINQAAWEAFRGGWIDIWQRGTLDVWKYDINSAYPWAMKDFPDLRHGEWRKELIPEAPIGFVEVFIKQEMGSVPALAAWLGKVHGYPYCDVPVRAWITLPEYLALVACEGVTLEPIKAFSFIAKQNAAKPLHGPCLTMLKYKNTFHPKRGSEPDPAAYLGSKMIFNSFYGNLCERIKQGDTFRAGTLFNPVYAAMTTGRTRALIIEAIKNDLDRIVTISTDCVTSTKPLALPIDEEELGQWKVEAEGETGTFVFPGIYEIGTETTHSRGFRISTCLCQHESKQHGLTNCQYCTCTQFQPSLKRLLAENVNANGFLEIRYERPWKAREAIRVSDIDLVGVFEKRLYEKGLEVSRRLWKESPTHFRDLLSNSYKSFPLPISLALEAMGTPEDVTPEDAGTILSEHA